MKSLTSQPLLNVRATASRQEGHIEGIASPRRSLRRTHGDDESFKKDLITVLRGLHKFQQSQLSPETLGEPDLQPDIQSTVGQSPPPTSFVQQRALVGDSVADHSSTPNHSPSIQQSKGKGGTGHGKLMDEYRAKAVKDMARIVGKFQHVGALQTPQAGNGEALRLVADENGSAAARLEDGGTIDAEPGLSPVGGTSCWTADVTAKGCSLSSHKDDQQSPSRLASSCIKLNSDEQETPEKGRMDSTSFEEGERGVSLHREGGDRGRLRVSENAYRLRTTLVFDEQEARPQGRGCGERMCAVESVRARPPKSENAGADIPGPPGNNDCPFADDGCEVDAVELNTLDACRRSVLGAPLVKKPKPVLARTLQDAPELDSAWELLRGHRLYRGQACAAGGDPLTTTGWAFERNSDELVAGSVTPHTDGVENVENGEGSRQMHGQEAALDDAFLFVGAARAGPEPDRVFAASGLVFDQDTATSSVLAVGGDKNVSKDAGQICAKEDDESGPVCPKDADEAEIIAEETVTRVVRAVEHEQGRATGVRDQQGRNKGHVATECLEMYKAQGYAEIGQAGWPGDEAAATVSAPPRTGGPQAGGRQSSQSSAHSRHGDDASESEWGRARRLQRLAQARRYRADAAKKARGERERTGRRGGGGRGGEPERGRLLEGVLDCGEGLILL